VTFGYPDQPSPEEQQAAVNLFESLQHLLPCPKCADHFCQGLSQTPVNQHVRSKQALTRWLVDFHNRVNARLGKPQMSYESVAQKYTSSDSVCPASKLLLEQEPACNCGSDRAQVAGIVAAIVATLCLIGAGLLIMKSVQK
jgi:hypothetical protein